MSYQAGEIASGRLSSRGPGRRGTQAISLRLKLMVYFLVILLIPLISLGFVGPALYAKSIERETTSHMASMIGQVNENIELHVREMERLIDLVAQTKVVASFIEKGAAKTEDQQEIRETLSTVSTTHPEIAGILVVAADDAWISDGFSRTTRDPLTEERWYAEACASPGAVRLFARPIGRNIRSTRFFGADEVVSIVKAVESPSSGAVRGARRAARC